MLELKRYIRPYWGYMLLTILIKLTGAVMELTIPYLMEQILDVKVPAGALTDIFLLGGAMLLCAAFCFLANMTANRMGAYSSGRITLAIRHDLFNKLEHLSARQLDELTISSAESRLTSDTYNINQLLARIQRMGIRAPMLLLGGVTMMMSMDIPLALVLLSLLPIIALVVYFVTKTSVPLYTKQQTILDRVVRILQENITGIRVIKALSKTEHEKERFNSVNHQLYANDLKAGFITAITNPVSSLTLNLGLTLVVIIGAYRVNNGQILSGVIVAFLQYFVMILNAMLGITRIFVMWSKGQASAKRVAQVLEEEEEMGCLAPTQPIENAPHIVFDNVSFSYTGIGKNIDSLSFSLEHGQTLGILGHTGSGKSTIISLLMRLYDPDTGTISIDGQDIRTIDYETLRKKFGVVFQNDFIAEGSITDNIRFFRDLSDADVEQAAKDAQADFIWEEKGGLDDEIVVRGNNLSGGQKQRLFIARALAANPEILVLDDSSSALDYATDSRLRAQLRSRYRNTTTIIVGQRISSLRHADLILVLHDGCVIGMGNHAHLLENCEEYRIISQIQMGDGREGA